jgi:hypothetical protein
MNRSVLFSATAMAAIALIAGVFLFFLKQGRDQSTDEAQRPVVRPDPGIPPEEVMRDSDARAAPPVRDNLDKPKADDSVAMTREQAVKEMIASMSEEDKQAKPEDYPMDLWAYFVANHHQQLRQNGDIEFYGKVVAEDGSPLPDVRVQVRVNTFEPSITKAIAMNQPTNMEDFNIITDNHGRFSVEHKLGVSLGLSLFEIKGYKVMEGQTFGYSFAPEEAKAALGPPHQADPANPVIFKMMRAELKPGYSLDDLD